MKHTGIFWRTIAAVLLTIPLDSEIPGMWTWAVALIASYLAFTAFTGECIVRDLVKSRVESTRNN